MTRWTLEPILDSYLAVALLTIGLAAMLLVGPTFGRLTRGRRWALIGMRLVIVLLLLLAMLRPARISTTSRPQSAVLLMLFDLSRSMQLPHSSGGKSRWQAQQEALQQAERELKHLAGAMEVKVYGYDEQLHAMELAQGKITLPKEPDGGQTDIGSTLDEAVQRELGQRLAGVILLGDGAQTAFTPRVEVQEAGRRLARLDYPLFTVTFGPAGDVAQARDVAIENLPEQYTVFVKNELHVKGQLRVRGYVNQEIPVHLFVEQPDGRQITAGVVRPRAREDGEQISVEIPFTPDRPGQYKLTLKAAEQASELVTRNNQLSAFLTVLEGGLRVLYLYGDLTGEQRILRRSIRRSPDIQLEDMYVDPRNRDRWKNDPVDLPPPPFDVLIIESVDSTALGSENLRAIERAVSRGQGLIMIGGYNSFGPGGFQAAPMGDILPITMGRFERQEVDPAKPISRDLHLWGELAMVPTRPHSITRLAPDENNVAVWGSLPPLNGANRLKVKPRSRVLLETPRGDPLLVAGDYGQGRVLAFAGNTTARWWQYGRQAEHRRFWRQLVLWLARRDDVSRNDVWVKLAQRRLNPGARVTFSAGARSATGDVIQGAHFVAQLVLPDGRQRPVPLTADEDQVSAFLEDLQLPGDYLIEVKVSKDGRELGSARANFQILDRDVELGNPAANYDLMARLAGLTKAAGGRPVAPEQLPDLLREIEQRRPEMQIEIQSKWQLADTFWDAWLFVIVFVAVIGTDWALRKKWGLV
ncbi:MAG: glutamine amidotransferase [Pirellulaceae bacterium]